MRVWVFTVPHWFSSQGPRSGSTTCCRKTILCIAESAQQQGTSCIVPSPGRMPLLHAELVGRQPPRHSAPALPLQPRLIISCPECSESNSHASQHGLVGIGSVAMVEVRSELTHWHQCGTCLHFIDKLHVCTEATAPQHPAVMWSK